MREGQVAEVRPQRIGGDVRDDDLPVGVQLMAAVQRDEQVYRVGAALEASLQERWGGPLLDQIPDLAMGGVA